MTRPTTYQTSAQPMDVAKTFTDLSGLKKISSDFCRLGNDYIFSHITCPIKEFCGGRDFHEPVKASGFTLFFTIEGNMTVDVNTQEYKLCPMSVLVVRSSSVVKILDVSSENIDAFYLYLSSQFLKDINIDLNVLNFSMMDRDPSPLVDNLTQKEAKLLSGYMYLLFLNADTNGETVYSKNVARSLTQALIYQMMQIGYNHSRSIETSEKNASRKTGYVKDFMTLVQKHHAQERTLSFYADKLFISPKYLSRIIKEATGRSAAEWIDDFVIIDAKNMLRFSSKNVQQVAYALNFSTQSSFGKFFKHLTGMSPSEYQQT